MAEIDWSLLKTPDFLGGAQNAFASGQKMGQQQATLNALRSYSSDPQGAMQGLIRSGNVEGANALANLDYTQQQRQLVTQGARRLFGGGQPQSADTTATDPQTAQRVKVLDTFDGAAAQLSSVPYAQRKAALAQMVPQLTSATGLTADQIAQFDPTDDNLAQIHQQTAQAHQQFGTQPSQPQPAAQPTQAAPGAPAFDLRDPRTQQAIGLIGMGNPQMGSFLTSLGTATMPKFAPGRDGAPIIDEHTGKITGYAPKDGVQYDVSNGEITGAHPIPGFAAATAATKGAVAGAVTNAEETAKSRHDKITVNLPDGTTQDMIKSDWEALQRSGLAGKLGLGRSQGPGPAQFAKDDAAAFSKEVDAHGPTAIASSQNARAVTEQAINLATNINPNAWTSQAGKVAGIINAATGGKIAAGAANNISTYQALLPQVLRGTFTTFPRLEKEFEIVQKAAANVNTPQDAAKILLGTQAAIQGRNLAYSTWLANGYNGAPSKQAMTKAFINSPQGQASIFADPIWRNMTIGGQPAVMVGAHPLQDGHVYGVFRPGTPYAQTFRVQ